MVCCCRFDDCNIRQSQRLLFFCFWLKKIKVTGYPRNDIIIDNSLYLKYMTFEKKIINSLKTNKNILYVPTFRDGDRYDRETPIDWDKLNKMMKENDCTFLIKLHGTIIL